MDIMREDEEADMILRGVDFDLLDALDDHGRNVAPNLAIHVDQSRSYVNQRLAVLLDYGLVERVGPEENTGLYEISARGTAALELREEYRRGPGWERDVDELAE